MAALSRLCDATQALAIALYRCVGDAAAPRLLRQASVRRGEACLPGDPPWTPVEALPAASDHPLHFQVLVGGRAVVDARPEADAPAHWRHHVVPLRDGTRRVTGLLDVLTEGPLAASRQHLVEAALRVLQPSEPLSIPHGDPLTGLADRQAFEAQFASCLNASAADAPRPRLPGDACWDARVAAGPRTAWLGLIVLAPAPEAQLLRRTARLLRGSFRHGDRLYRLDAGRFAVLLRAGGAADVEQAFARPLQSMQAAATLHLACVALQPLDTPATALARAERRLQERRFSAA